MSSIADASAHLTVTANQPTAVGSPDARSPTQAKPFLIVIGDAARRGEPPPPASRLIPIGDLLPIGRAVKGNGWTLSHRRASSRHAVIRKEATGYVVSDTASTNGSFKNGHLVEADAPLSNGDLLFFGGHAAVFRLLTPEDAEDIGHGLQSPFTQVASASLAVARLEAKLRVLAPTSSEVLLVGETGVGKEVYAAAIHAASGRKGAFVPVNCAAIPRDLVESELFGYAKGAHSQAIQPKAGLVDAAVGGTLFLDELGDMPHSAQAKLLRFLQTREVMPLGATRAKQLDVRVVAATSRMEPEADSPGLRADLVGRMGAAAITLPALRERREDIGAFIDHQVAASRTTDTPFEIDPSLFFALCLYRWPRNIRELTNVVHTATLFAGVATTMTFRHVPESLLTILDPQTSSAEPPRKADGDTSRRPANTRRPPRELPTRAELERELSTHQGNVMRVARALDRHPKVIRRALQQHQIEANAFRVPKRP
ncbi:MAG: sigma 54-interacting transcriptional regulator [Deltaproteobacteria bacterium]|nr:sigma 54-interacting transcriptional regulator [Deltaproteobacteria bacterium]